jgi:hypothetical protein
MGIAARHTVVVRLIASMLVAAALLAPFTGAAPSAHACSCMGLSGDETRVRERLEEADGAIVGVVTGIETLDPVTPASSFVVIDSTIAVEKVYDGDIQREIVVRQVGDSAACGYEATAGRHFMLLYEDEGVTQTNSCSAFPVQSDGTAPDYAADFMATLERIAPPVAPGDFQVIFATGRGDDGSDSARWWIVGVAAVAGAAALAAGVWMLRREA